MRKISGFIGLILVPLALALSLSGTASAQTTPATKAFDSCFSCFGQDPSNAWFHAEHAAGYRMMIIDPDTWNSEFPDGNADDPGPATGCQMAADSKQIINSAIYEGFKVAIYNRNLNCYGTIRELGHLEHLGTPLYIWDVETQPGLVPSTADVAAVTKLGYTSAVYTWDGAVSQKLSESSLPLFFDNVSNWNCAGCAAPSGFPYIDAIQPFDGWKSADIEQQGTGTLNGMNVDYDSVNTNWLASLR